MGTQFKPGEKPKNNVTVFTGNDKAAPASIDPTTGRRVVKPVQPEVAPAAPPVEEKEAEASQIPSRSLAQPSKQATPAPTPKTHASDEDADEAVRKHSTMRQGEDNDEDEGQDDSAAS